MRVAIYGHISTSLQVDHQTIEQQLGRLTSYVCPDAAGARSLTRPMCSGITVTAAPSSPAPVLDRLRDVVRSRETGRVLVTAPDGIARNYVHETVLLEE
jgi:site-specific DNA recombinase